jgi:hypothetical protein
MVSVKTLIGTLFAGLLLFGFAKPAPAEVNVSIDRNPLRVNETFQLVFSIDDRSDHDPDFSLLQQHFIILGNQPGSSTSLVNGEYRRGMKWTLQLMPKQVGELTIPAIRFDRERSKPLQIKVEPSALSSVPQDELTLQLLADVDEVYVQGQVLLTLRLLSASDISVYQFGGVEIDSLDVVIEALDGERQYQARIADRRYLVRERRYALFPQQSGRLEVGPAVAEAEARYDNFQTGGLRRIRSRPLALEVRPIPADHHGAYWLPAKRLELREDWRGDTSALIAGEPVTRSLTLLADGLTAAQLPQLALPAIDGIKQYLQQSDLENSRKGAGIRGKRAQEVTLIAGAAGVYRVPGLRVPWWNLETGKMEVATLPARELVVAPAAGVALSPAAAKAENLAVAPAPAVAEDNRLWLWSSLLLGCGWAASGFYWWNRSRRAPPRATAPTENESLKAARRRLYASCATNDAAAARYALLAWGRALLAPREVTNLHRLNEVFDGSLVPQIEALDRSLYAKDHAAWRGGELADLCRRLEREQPGPPREQAGLMPLNPA